MENDKDIRFTNKKVDESWKEQASREKETLANRPESKVSPSSSSDSKYSAPRAEELPTSREFINLLSSLGYQAMMHLGEIPEPSTGQKEVNLEAAKEIIDLLAALQVKTEGRRSPEESQILKQIVPELQMKFSQIA